MRSSKNANRNGRAARPPALASALMSNLTYSDDYIAEILDTTKTIAIVGASPNWVRPSHFAMKYLQRKGYRVIPVNPGAAGTMLLDEEVYQLDGNHCLARACRKIDDVVRCQTQFDRLELVRTQRHHTLHLFAQPFSLLVQDILFWWRLLQKSAIRF